MKIVTFELSEEEHERFSAICREEGINRSRFSRDATIAAMIKHETKKHGGKK